MTKQTIEVEGLPEGREIELVEIMPSGFGDKSGNNLIATVKLKEIQPLRIVLEETGEERNRPRLNSYTYFYTDSEGFDRFKVLREVKEPDIPLTNDEPKLSLSVKECGDLLKMYNNVFDKIREFIKENS